MSKLKAGAILILSLALAACGGDGDGNGDGGNSSAGGQRQNAHVMIEPGPEAQTQALEAFFNAREGTVIEFGEGQYDFSSGLLMSDTRGVTIRGAGMNKTILNFANSDNKEGIFASHVEGLTIEDLTVEDMPGDGVKVSDGRYITIRRVKVRWTNADPEHPNYTGNTDDWRVNGAYAFYPVLTEDIIIEDCVSIGSSDVGFYVGQSQDVIVRRNLAFHNVQGYEFENTDNSEMHDNEATNNAGGFLTVDLPGRTRYGDTNRLYRNKIHNNNLDNFAPKGTIAAAVPRGTGIIVLATDGIEIFDNDIHDNDTLGIVVVSYGLIDSSRDPRFDYYAEGTHIHNNRFADNGTNPQPPNVTLEEVLNPDALLGNPSLLPMLIQLKNLGQTAHIAWDGYTDSLNPDCPYPEGVEADANGKPQYRDEEAASDCGFNGNTPVKYNAYKFDDNGALIKPEQWLCIHDNSFNDAGLLGLGLLPTPPFANFMGTLPEPIGGSQDGLLASRDLAPHRCELPALAATVVEQYQPGSGGGSTPSPAEVARLCSGGTPGQINRAALAVNCPQLSDYGLFNDPDDPRGNPRGGGIPFDLTTPLFSDYASKYRIVFLPPGQSASWRDHNQGPNAHIDFPVGTVIAKTFTFKDGEAEDIVETRLLIKRETVDGGVTWTGLPYLWQTENGERVAKLAVAGATAQVSWDYADPDPRVVDENGQRLRYTGSTEAYAIPQASQCVTCHAREGLDPGSAPIGPKPRSMNRDHDYGGNIGVRNQLDYWCSSGFLTDCPANLSEAEDLPEYNVPGSSGELPGSAADVEARARAYLEANCSHCHNPRGVAKSTRMYLDQWIRANDGGAPVVTPRPVNRDYGICKSPVASGRGTGDRLYDIVPGDPNASIMHFRVGNGDDPAIRMPPVSKSVVHAEGHALIEEWVGLLPLPTTEDNNCSGAFGGLPAPIGDVLGAVPLP